MPFRNTAIIIGLAGLLSGASAADRPNILWLVSEDNDPLLGCYGDKLARTPTLDQLAKEGVLFEHCYSGAPVCAPSRFTLISGMYPASCGPANQMRAKGNIPAWLRGFPAYLREAGYFTSNNAKTDYNAPIDMKDTWDAAGKSAHWRDRKPGQPFFSVFNMEITHESCLHPGKRAKAGEKTVTDPAAVRIPAYQPDTPEFRSDWARYYDRIAEMDARVAQFLKELETDGLAEDTIVFYYSDNGGVLPRSKRFVYDSGCHVPLIVRVPAKFRQLAPATPGTRVADVVGFVDFAPTVLSLAGVEPKKYMAGTAFAGTAKGPSRGLAFVGRDRMDGTVDMCRSVRDERFCYIRNYMPHLPYSVFVTYQFQSPAYQAWARLQEEGKLTGLPAAFWKEKPTEELYDADADPDQTRNLVNEPAHRGTLDRLRAALRKHLVEIRDNGFLPESSPLQGYEPSRDAKAYPVERVIDAADLAGQRAATNLPAFIAGLDDPNDTIRYWSALGCVMLRTEAAPAADALAKKLDDPSPAVRLAAAEALCQLGQTDRALGVVIAALKADSVPVQVQAANVLEHLGPAAQPALPAITQWLARPEDAKREDYPRRVLQHVVEKLGTKG